jgi:hypothetical protein
MYWPELEVAHARLAEQGRRAGERAQRVLREARAAQRSAADSVQKSAESHERTARSYELAAQHSGRPDRYLEHAARHHEFAEEDRRMAERLRRMATTDASHVGGCYPVTDDERADLAQWSKDARQRSRKAVLHLLRQKRRAESLLSDSEDRLGRAAADYRRALLSDTHRPS